MDEQRVCHKCGKSYKQGTFGSGRMYCSAQCRVTKNSNRALSGRTGQPNRHPLMGIADTDKVIELLGDAGFEMHRLDPETRNKLVICKDQWHARIGIGGGWWNRHVHSIVWLHNHNKLGVSSACVRGKFKKRQTGLNPHVPWAGFKTGPCYTPHCKKCLQTRMLRMKLEFAHDRRKLLYRYEEPVIERTTEGNEASTQAQGEGTTAA